MATKKPRKRAAPAKPVPRAVKPKPKAGRSAEASAERRKLFLEYYQANGHNATEAAIAAGCSPRSARKQGWAMLHEGSVQEQLRLRARKVAALAEMDTESWAREVRAIASSRIGDVLDALGMPIPVEKLPGHVQAALASVKFKKDGSVEYKLWDKNAALEKAMKFHGLYREDNDQTRPVIVNSINYADMHKPKKAA